MRLAVEADVRQPDEPKVVQSDGTALVPRAPRHQLASLAVEPGDRGHERLVPGARGGRRRHDREDQGGGDGPPHGFQATAPPPSGQADNRSEARGVLGLKAEGHAC